MALPPLDIAIPTSNNLVLPVVRVEPELQPFEPQVNIKELPENLSRIVPTPRLAVEVRGKDLLEKVRSVGLQEVANRTRETDVRLLICKITLHALGANVPLLVARLEELANRVNTIGTRALIEETGLLVVVLHTPKNDTTKA